MNAKDCLEVKSDDFKSVIVTGAWVRVVKGTVQLMLEIDGKWREIVPNTYVANADMSLEISGAEIQQSQPLGWLYKEGG